jgi:hypothetical protein
VEETLVPGASVSRVARRHDVNANQVFHWRKLYQCATELFGVAACVFMFASWGSLSLPFVPVVRDFLTRSERSPWRRLQPVLFGRLVHALADTD